MVAALLRWCRGSAEPTQHGGATFVWHGPTPCQEQWTKRNTESFGGTPAKWKKKSHGILNIRFHSCFGAFKPRPELRTRGRPSRQVIWDACTVVSVERRVLNSLPPVKRSGTPVKIGGWPASRGKRGERETKIRVRVSEK